MELDKQYDDLVISIVGAIKQKDFERIRAIIILIHEYVEKSTDINDDQWSKFLSDIILNDLKISIRLISNIYFALKHENYDGNQNPEIAEILLQNSQNPNRMDINLQVLAHRILFNIYNNSQERMLNKLILDYSVRIRKLDATTSNIFFILYKFLVSLNLALDRNIHSDSENL
jgi:hypothetical protein